MGTSVDLADVSDACFEHNMELSDRAAKRRAARKAAKPFADNDKIGPGRKMIRDMKRAAGLSNHGVVTVGNPKRTSLLYTANKPVIAVERVRERLRRLARAR